MGFVPSILLESGMGSGFLGACLGFKKNLPKIRSEKTYPTNVSHPGFCWGKKCSQTHNSPDRNRIWSFGWIAWTAESYRKAWEQRLRDSSTKQEADCMMGRQKRLEFWSWLSCSYKMYMIYIYIYYIYYIWLLRILIASRGKQKGKYIIHLILWAIESGRFQVLPLFSWKLSVLPLKNGWLEDYFSWGHLLFFFWRCHYPILSPCMEYFSTFSWFFNGKCR